MRACRLDSKPSIRLVLLATALVLGSQLVHAAEPARVMRLGFVSPFSPSTDVRSVDGFWQRLRELGWVEGQNLIIEPRWAEGHTDRLPALMAEVTEHKIDVLVTTVYSIREYVDSGGLMAYGSDRAVLFRRAADYVDKILRGAKPGDLPLEQPTQYELIVNLKTAKAIGLTFPQSILVRADEVIR